MVSIWVIIGNSVNYIRKNKSSMNQKLKQAGLFAILAVFTMSLTTSLVDVAEATSSDKADHSRELVNLNVEASPSLLEIAVEDHSTRLGTDFVVTGDVTTFTAVYAVLNPANIDLRDVEILVSSDTESVKGELIENYREDFSIITFEIDAVDPASVNAKIIG